MAISPPDSTETRPEAAPCRTHGSVVDRHLGFRYQTAPCTGWARACTGSWPQPRPRIGCHGRIELHPFEDHDEEDGDDAGPSLHDPSTRAEERRFGYHLGRLRLQLPDADPLRLLVDRYGLPPRRGSPPRRGPGPRGLDRRVRTSAPAVLRDGSIDHLAGGTLDAQRRVLGELSRWPIRRSRTRRCPAGSSSPVPDPAPPGQARPPAHLDRLAPGAGLLTDAAAGDGVEHGCAGRSAVCRGVTG